MRRLLSDVPLWWRLRGARAWTGRVRLAAPEGLGREGRVRLAAPEGLGREGRVRLAGLRVSVLGGGRA